MWRQIATRGLTHEHPEDEIRRREEYQIGREGQDREGRLLTFEVDNGCQPSPGQKRGMLTHSSFSHQFPGPMTQTDSSIVSNNVCAIGKYNLSHKHSVHVSMGDRWAVVNIYSLQTTNLKFCHSH